MDMTDTVRIALLHHMIDVGLRCSGAHWVTKTYDDVCGLETILWNRTRKSMFVPSSILENLWALHASVWNSRVWNGMGGCQPHDGQCCNMIANTHTHVVLSNGHHYWIFGFAARLCQPMASADAAIHSVEGMRMFGKCGTQH